MIGIIDNFDSFTYNLVDEFLRRGHLTRIYRNDVSIERLQRIAEKEKWNAMVFSPGPSSPEEAGISIEAVRAFAGKIPMLGVCLGHQAIVVAFGGRVSRAPMPVHGKHSLIYHCGRDLFESLPNPMGVARYHSLCAVEMPDVLETTASCHALPFVTGSDAIDLAKISGKHLVMALKHKKFPIWGVQFHPESFLTPEGGRIIDRFVELSSAKNYVAV
ncbi:aminodeoxychorismate/anthranilate synthase component II [bacterium]|nr:aminodeoxychorismate/anthranilate synthase component II [bacterium]